MRKLVRVAGAASLTAALAAAVAVTAAGCSSRDDGSAAPSSGTNAYVECMRANGVTVELPGQGARGSRDPSGGPRANPSGRPGGAPPSGGRRSGVRPSGSWPSGVRPSGAWPSGAWPSGAWPSGGPPGGPGGFGNRAPSGVDASVWAKAQEACASLRPSGGPGGGRQGGSRDDGADAAYRNCLSEHGAPVSAGASALDSSDPKTAAAMQACAVLRPSATSS